MTGAGSWRLEPPPRAPGCDVHRTTSSLCLAMCRPLGELNVQYGDGA